MKHCAALFILSSSIAFSAHASTQDQEVLNSIKQVIKPVELKDDTPISMKYDMPIAPVNMKLGEAIRDTNISGKLAKESSGEPDNVDGLLEKAYKASSVGSLEAAIVIYKKVLTKDPKNINALFALGSIYQKLNQFHDAKTMYAKVLAIEPRHNNAISNYLALMVQESPTGALNQLKELERTNPDFSPVKAQIGMVYAKLGEYDMAEMYMKRAISLSPEILNYRYNLAVMLDKSGRQQAAIQVYRQLLDIGANDLSPDMSKGIRSRINDLQNQITRE